MRELATGIGRTTIICLALVVICLSVATTTWRSSPIETLERPGSVDSVSLIQRGRQAAVPVVTASFEHEGTVHQVQFDRGDRQLEVGDSVPLIVTDNDPAAATPQWAAEAERGNRKFLAVCLWVAAAVALALALADVRSKLGRPLTISYHGHT